MYHSRNFKVITIYTNNIAKNNKSIVNYMIYLIVYNNMTLY